MKKLKYLAAASLLLAGCAVSYWMGYNAQDGKNYEAACLQADFIHHLMDSDKEPSINGSEVEESFYEWFQDLDMGVYNTKHLSLKELEDYSWCY